MAKSISYRALEVNCQRIIADDWNLWHLSCTFFRHLNGTGITLTFLQHHICSSPYTHYTMSCFTLPNMDYDITPQNEHYNLVNYIHAHILEVFLWSHNSYENIMTKKFKSKSSGNFFFSLTWINKYWLITSW